MVLMFTRQLFQQQRFVSEYLNDNTPYRGELLYHGLGSGKSGASIATSEGFHNRQIVVMLPASLRANYEIEIEKWANVGYRRTHKWCFVPLILNGKRVNNVPLSTNEPVIKMLVEKGIPRELLDHSIKNDATRCRKTTHEYSKMSESFFYIENKEQNSYKICRW